MNDKKIKCIVWDLDHTLWEGILLENDDVLVNDKIINTIKELDKRGILHSIASKNESEIAMSKLVEAGISEYFLYPQINWNTKSTSIRKIASLLNISLDTIAFVDDQAFERDEVNFELPEVLCIDVQEADGILELSRLNPVFITEDSKNRRLMYINDCVRNKEEEKYEGVQEEFLATLGMILYIDEAKEEDLRRVEELILRTNQLNTTGYTYSYEEMDKFCKSDKHKLLIAGLNDKYGYYGKIGVMLIEMNEEIWMLKLLLMSCRVMSKGVGTVLLNYIMNIAREAGVRLLVEFYENDRNRMMYITLKFAGFREISKKDGLCILENDFSRIQQYPEYISLIVGKG